MRIVINIPDNEYECLSYQDITSLRSYIEKGIIIPERATNGDMIKAMFNIPDSKIDDEALSTTYIYTRARVLKGGSQDYLREQITFNKDWWNAPYKVER